MTTPNSELYVMSLPQDDFLRVSGVSKYAMSLTQSVLDRCYLHVHTIKCEDLCIPCNAFLFLVVVFISSTTPRDYPLCEFDKECKIGENCRYHHGTRGLPPALCNAKKFLRRTRSSKSEDGQSADNGELMPLQYPRVASGRFWCGSSGV